MNLHMQIADIEYVYKLYTIIEESTSTMYGNRRTVWQERTFQWSIKKYKNKKYIPYICIENI